VRNKHRSVTAEFIYRFCEAYPQINLEWFLNGKGTMMKGSEVVADQVLLPESKNDNAREKDIRYGTLRGGILESLLARVQTLEDKVSEMEDELSELGKGRSKKET
jgi:hypothetical protein